MKHMIRMPFAAWLFFPTADSWSSCSESFEEFLKAIQSDDSVLQDNSDGYYIEELVLEKDGSSAERRKLGNILDEYTYQGRIFPSTTQQNEKGMSIYVRRVVLNDVRVVTEKLGNGTEPSSYWFSRDKGCWRLRSRAVNVAQ